MRLFGHTGVITTSGVHRRATDGILSRAAGMERLVRLAGRRARRTLALAVAAAHDGLGVWRWPAGGRDLAAGGRSQRRLSGLLLFLADGRPRWAGIGTTGVGARLASGAPGSAAGLDRDRRFADEAVRAEGARGRDS